MALIGLAQIALNVLCTTVGLVNLTNHLIQQGISDLMAAFKAIKGGGYFSWKEWGIQKAISIAVAFIGAGLKAVTKWVGDKIAPSLKQSIKNFAGKCKALSKRFTGGFTTNDASKTRILLKKAGARLAGGIVKDLVQTLVNDGLDELLIKRISAAIEKKVTDKIIESLEKNTWVQAAIALDVKNDSNHWQNIFQQEGLAILQDPGSEFRRACKEVLKGVVTNEVLDQLKKTTSGSVQLVEEFIQAAPQMAEATHKALTLTGTFLTKFESKIQQKYKKDIEKVQKEQKEKEEQQQQQEERQQTQVAMHVVNAPPPVDEEDMIVPKVVVNQAYTSDLRDYYYEAPSSAGNLYSTFSSHLTRQITSQIQQGIIHPLAGIGVNMGVDKMLAGVHEAIEKEEARYMSEGGGDLSNVTNIVGNDAEEKKNTKTEREKNAAQHNADGNEKSGGSSASGPVAPENQYAADEVRNDAQFDRTTAAHLANQEGRPVYIYEKDKRGKVKLVDIVGDELRGDSIRFLHTSSNDGNTKEHWELHLTKIDIKRGKVLRPMDGNGKDNCGFAAAACQIEGVGSAHELREQLADHIATSPHTAALRTMQQRMQVLNPGVLMRGGVI